ncbi:BOLA class I histocompatibility antigen, alpha chain BL3-7-like isoform X5 [Anguilla anguilla]|uniref:BOLA class I histocompatibility antigen, alpha chain BL3-7-like isoform X5 n=1 Tax=Anguilla anguilla TaxID=7936 RepID=UPI0015B37618|nr:BOLA class I histocompatibility antigen, alpha chain BL3-7-like isoform X5 [Anguilla anguilla]
MGKLGLLALTLCSIQAAFSASHSLKYFYTGVTAGIDFPEFTALGLVDDEQITYYDSNIERMIPKTEWVKENVGADYWDRETRKALGTQQTFKADIGNLMRRFNQTQGVHTYQNMYGCEWDDETGATGGFDQYGYDGEDFLTYDLRNQRFIAPVQQAFITAVKWNNDPALLENLKQYFTQECVDWLKKYVSYGRSALERTVAPKVSLLQKDPSSPVTCHVTGFYPRGVMVIWQRNGKDLDEDVELGETVPNEDGTFQTTSHLTVKPEDWKSQKYTCTVQHKSLKQDIVLPVKEENIKRNSDIKIAPEVSLLQKDSSSRVTCHVTGFYPRGFMVTWQRNGEDLHEDVELGETVPNEDGTFQTTSHLTVKAEDWKGQKYTCTVQQKSPKQEIVLPVKEENIKGNSDIKNGSSPPMGIIIGCVVGALILILAVIGVLIWKKRSSGYRTTNTSDTGSEGSDRPAVKA